MQEYLKALLSQSIAWRVVWGRFDEGPGLPRAVLSLAGGAQNYTQNGPALVMGSVQVDVYGTTYSEATLAAREVKAILDGHRGGPILGMFRQSERDMTAEDTGAILARVSLSYAVTYREQLQLAAGPPASWS